MKLTRYTPPTMKTWTPLDRLATWRDEVNRMFEHSLPAFAEEEELFSGWSPALDVYDDKESLFVKMEVPGMKKEDIHIALEDGTLTISGERKGEKEEEDAETFRTERFFGKFHRALALPTRVEPDKVNATYTDGVLTVRMPKAEDAKPKQIDVTID